MLIPGYPEGSDITIVNTQYLYPKQDDKGKWSKDVLQVVYRDNISNKKKMIEMEEPDYLYFMAKNNVPIDHNLLFTNKDKLEEKVIKYRELEKTIANDTGNINFFYDNLRNGNRQANQKLHTFPKIFFSDMDLQDNYRWRFDNIYKNEIISISKSYFDIEVDGINQKGDFPEMGECPINAITIILENENQVYTLLLRNKENPLIEEFEKSLSPDLFAELKNFIIDKVGGWKNEIRYGLKDFNYNILFYDEEIQLIADMFRLYNVKKPDFALAWNMKFDIPYIIERIKVLGYNPEEIMCHPDFKNKIASYYIDTKNEGKPEEKGDYCKLSSYTVFLDQLIQFASRRKGQGQYKSMKLDYIGGLVAKVKKLDYSHITTIIAELPYKDFKTFVFYNIMDTIVQKCIESKTKDIDYLFSKCLINNTRYQKGHRQTVYLVNRARKEFYKDGFVMGNNLNRFGVKPEVKFPGAFVANTKKLSPDPKLKINGYPVYIVDNCDDFDYKSLYPSIMRELNISHNTQIGMVTIDQKVWEYENRFNWDKWTRSVEFVENFQTHSWLEFCNRWLGLADYSTLYDDVVDYYTNIKVPYLYKPYDIETGRTNLLRYYDKPVELLTHFEENEKVNLLSYYGTPDLNKLNNHFNMNKINEVNIFG